MADTTKADMSERTKAGASGRHVLQGRVVSDRMDRTVVVAVERVFRHPLYKKTVRRTKRYKAHDEQNQCGVGDLVEITETRHLSKDKYFRVSRIIEKAK